MKTHLRLTAFIAAALLFQGCGPDDGPNSNSHGGPRVAAAQKSKSAPKGEATQASTGALASQSVADRAPASSDQPRATTAPDSTLAGHSANPRDQFVASRPPQYVPDVVLGALTDATSSGTRHAKHSGTRRTAKAAEYDHALAENRETYQSKQATVAELEAERVREQTLKVELEAERATNQDLRAELEAERIREQTLKAELGSERAREQDFIAELRAENAREWRRASSQPSTSPSGAPPSIAPGETTASTAPRYSTVENGSVSGAATNASNPSSSSSTASDQSSQAMAEYGMKPSPPPDQSSQSAATFRGGEASEIQRVIEDRLQNEPSLSNAKIEVRVADSKVELTGTVASKDQKKTAKQIAESYSSGMKVIDHMKVQSEGGTNTATPPKL